MFAGSGSDSLFTIQFLYQEDVAKYVDEKYIRKVDQDSDSQKEIIVSEFATALMGNVIFSQQVESLGDELLIQGIVAKYFTA